FGEEFKIMKMFSKRNCHRNCAGDKSFKRSSIGCWFSSKNRQESKKGSASTPPPSHQCSQNISEPASFTWRKPVPFYATELIQKKTQPSAAVEDFNDPIFSDFPALRTLPTVSTPLAAYKVPEVSTVIGTEKTTPKIIQLNQIPHPIPKRHTSRFYHQNPDVQAHLESVSHCQQMVLLSKHLRKQKYSVHDSAVLPMPNLSTSGNKHSCAAM
ncbi:hypothetical protein BDF14DRAFT_1845188, partial [Spinellus fusiger]